jgi:phosphoribosylamine--glycine ligase
MNNQNQIQNVSDSVDIPDDGGNSPSNSSGQGKKNANPSRKFLFISVDALAVDLAWQLSKEGNEVKMYIRESESKDIADGFVEKVDEWATYLDWADVIVVDSCGRGALADDLRKKGKLVIGGSVYTDKLEMDREFGQTEMKAVGMNVLPHWDFEDFDEGIQFIETHPMRYVFKPSGEESLDWYLKSLLFLGQEEDGKDILAVMKHNQESWSEKIKEFQLQKFATGIEVAVSAFFNGHDFIYPVNVNFEHKKLFPGDIGPYTGEMGTLMYWDETNNLFKATLLRMQDRLRESKYIGCIDINCIVNGKGIYPLEFTTRFGYPTISIMIEGVQSPWGEFLYALAKGEDYKLKTRKGFQLGVVVAVPPFPYYDKEQYKIYKDMSIVFKKPNLAGVHIGDVKLEDGDWKLTGDAGYALIITGSDNTVEGARKEAYHRIENIILQNMFYRTDIGLKWGRESDELQAWGLL